MRREDIRSVDTNLQVTDPVAPPAEGATLGQQLGAAFRLENVVGAGLDEIFATDHFFPAEPGFNPAEHLLPGEEVNYYRYSGAKSLSELNAIRQEVDTEVLLRQQLGDGPLPALLATTLAVLGDPTNYIPFLGWGKGALTAGKVALRVGLTSAVEVAASEAAFHALQRTRTVEQSALAVMMGGAFGAGIGALGGAAAARSAKAYEGAVRDMTIIAHGAEAAPAAPAVTGSVGAAVVPTVRAEDTVLVSTAGLATLMSKMRGVVAPALELAASPIAASRRIIASLVDIGVITRGNLRSIASDTPVEIMIKRGDAADAYMGARLGDGYRQHTSAGGTLSRVAWLEEVGKSMRRGDEHPDASIAAAAKDMREKIIEPLKKAAIEAKLLPADVSTDTAVSYFTRVYDREKINARQAEFEGLVGAYLRTVVPLTEVAGDGEYALMARDITNAIMGGSAGRVPFLKVPRARGPMKERTFNIEDTFEADGVKFESFLASNAQEVLSRYLRTMGADIAMARKFGTHELDKIGQKLADDIRDEARDTAAKATTEKERTAINDRAKREGALAQELYNRIRGVSSTPFDPRYAGMRAVGKVLRDYNFVRLLGGVMLSSVMDLGQIVAQEGFTRTFGTLALDAARGFKGIKLSIKEAQMAGTALEMNRSQRLRSVFDLGERYGVQTAIERAADRGTQIMADWSGINAWNTVLKGTTSMLAGTRILRTVEKLAAGKELSRRERYRLAQSYIDDDMARRIASQAEHFDRHTDITLANTEVWKDKDAVEAFRNALLADVDRTILTPGHGDAPLWTSSEWGKTIFQFKRFSSASMTRILLLNMQAHDATALAGVTAMFGLGVLSQILKDVAAHGEVQERTPREWAVDGVDRSGILGLFTEGDALMGKMSGGHSAMSAIAGREPSRFAERGALAQGLGPTAGLVDDMAQAVAGVANKDFTQPDLRRLRRLVPGQNLFYLQYLLNKAEDGLGASLGLPAQQARPTANRRALLPTAP